MGAWGSENKTRCVGDNIDLSEAEDVKKIGDLGRASVGRSERPGSSGPGQIRRHVTS